MVTRRFHKDSREVMNDGPSPLGPSNIKQIVKEDSVFN
jgi:hypothetical protein